MGEELIYTKISELPITTTLDDDDIFVLNHLKKTSTIKFITLMAIINSKVEHDLTDIINSINELKQNYSTLSTTVANNTETINNIITAGFNLIGLD